MGRAPADGALAVIVGENTGGLGNVSLLEGKASPVGTGPAQIITWWGAYVVSGVEGQIRSHGQMVQQSWAQRSQAIVDEELLPGLKKCSSLWL